MADIELVIKIDEVQKKMVDAIIELPPLTENDLISAIRHGMPLPKGHGRLIDADDVNNHIIGYVNLSSCPTIIEADKAENED